MLVSAAAEQGSPHSLLASVTRHVRSHPPSPFPAGPTTSPRRVAGDTAQHHTPSSRGESDDGASHPRTHPTAERQSPDKSRPPSPVYPLLPSPALTPLSFVRLRHPRVDAHPPPAARPAVAPPLRRAPGPRHLQASGQPLPPPRLLLLLLLHVPPPTPFPALRAVTFAPMDWYGVQGWAAAGAAAWAEQHGTEPSDDELCRGHFPHAGLALCPHLTAVRLSLFEHTVFQLEFDAAAFLSPRPAPPLPAHPPPGLP